MQGEDQRIPTTKTRDEELQISMKSFYVSWRGVLVRTE